MAKILRIFMIFFVIMFLSLLLSSSIVLFSLSNTVRADNLKPLIKDIFESAVPQEVDINDLHAEFSVLCREKQTIELPLDNENEESLKIDCREVSGSSPNELKEVIADAMFKKVYYKEYDCVFFDCLKNSLSSSFLISERAYEVLKVLSYILFGCFIVVLLFFTPLIGFKGISLVFFMNGTSSFMFFFKQEIAGTIGVAGIEHLVPFIALFIHYFSLLCSASLLLAGVFFIISLIFKKKETPETTKTEGKKKISKKR